MIFFKCKHVYAYIICRHASIHIYTYMYIHPTRLLTHLSAPFACMARAAQICKYVLINI